MATSPQDSPPPPDSWPGAAGKRSVAPDVPSWPGAAPRGDAGGSWPGAGQRADSWPGASTPQRSLPSEDDDGRQGGVAGVLFPAVTVLILLSAVGLWVFLDADHRDLQMAALIAILAVAMAALGVSVYRHRNRL